MTTMIADLAPTALAVALLALVTAGVLMIVRAPRPWTPVIAIARGIAQLAILSVILTGIIASPVWIACALVVMFTVASVVVVLIFALAGALQDMGQTSGIAGIIIAVSAILQRVIVYPPIAAWIALHVPWLAPTPPSETESI